MFHVNIIPSGTGDASKATEVTGVNGCTEVRTNLIVLLLLISTEQLDEGQMSSRHLYLPHVQALFLQVACGTAVSYAVTGDGKLYR